jgi:hypothetical protein
LPTVRQIFRIARGFAGFFRIACRFAGFFRIARGFRRRIYPVWLRLRRLM